MPQPAQTGEAPPLPDGLPPGGALTQEEIKTLLSDDDDAGKNAA